MGNAWGHGASGFGRGFMNGYQFVQGAQDRDAALEKERRFGETLRSMYGPQPGDATGMPQNIALPQRPVPMPGARPMPNTATMPAGAPPPTGAPPMPGAPPSQAMQPMNDFGPSGPQAGPFPRAPEMPMQQPQDLTWQNVIKAAAKQLGTSDPRALAGIVDSFLPLMNSNSQMEWRDLKGKFDARKQRDLQGHRERGYEDRDQDQELREEKFTEGKRVNDARIKRINTQVASAATQAKLPPETKATLDIYMKMFTRADTSLSVARTNLQRAMFEGSAKNKQAAQADVAMLQQQRDEAQRELTDYMAQSMPKANIDFSESAEPGAAPPITTGPLKKGANDANAPASYVKTKGGNTAQLGNENVVAPKRTAPYAPPTGESGRTAQPPASVLEVTATPAPKSAKALPLPKSKTMLVKDRIYDIPGKGPHKFTGTGFVPVK